MYILVSEYDPGGTFSAYNTSINLETNTSIEEAIDKHTQWFNESYGYGIEITHRLFKQVEVEFSYGLIIKD